MNDPVTYREHIDTMFLAEYGASRVQLRLADVVEERVSGGLQQFSLLFHGPTDRVLPQDMYVFSHDALGSLELFIVPVIGSNRERIVYQACFSRPVP